MEPATRHKGASRDEAIDAKLRLDSQKLLDLAAALSDAIDTARAARWSRRTEWVAFIEDAEQLALGLDKLGDGNLAQARRTRDGQNRTETARSTADSNCLHVEMIEEKPPKEPERYALLLNALLSVVVYTPVRVLDSHMVVRSDAGGVRGRVREIHVSR